MIFLLFVIVTSGISQSNLDQAAALIRSSAGQTFPAHVPAGIPGSPTGCLGRYLSGFCPEPGRADIIVGDTPGETLSVTGYFYNNGNIYVMNDGVVILRDADFNLDGDIALMQHGRFLADSSQLNFLQAHIYHRGITVADSSYCRIQRSYTTFGGYPFSIYVGHHAEIELLNVTNRDWITAVVGNQGRARLDHVSITGEWLLTDQCYVTFNRVDQFLSWYFFPAASVVDMVFPDGDSVNGFYFDSTLSSVHGIGYHVAIDSSTNCMWAGIPLPGSDVDIDSSRLRVTGVMFEGADTFTVSGLVNGLEYQDYVLPLADRHYHLTNTSVQTWNLYPSDSVNLALSSSIFGELCAYGSSQVTIMNADCDGSGGHIEAANNSFLIVGYSSIFADIITKNHGLCIVALCAMPMGNIWATGASILALVNTQFPEDPIPSDTAIVFVAAVTGPSNAAVDDTVAVMGSAWIDRGPYQTVDFGSYRMSYRVAGSSAWIPFGDSNTVEVRRNILEYWITTGLTPGPYEVRLVLKDNLGDSIECAKGITLRLTGIEEAVTGPQTGLKIIRRSSRAFRVENASLAGAAIYNQAGRLVFRTRSNSFDWTADRAGVYFLRSTGPAIKVIAY